MFEEFGDRDNNKWIHLSNGTVIHKTAIISPWVRFESNCLVNPYSIIGRMPDDSSSLARKPRGNKILSIGIGSIIGCHCVIYSDVVLGNRCFIGDYASVREGTRIGDDCVIGRQVTINYNVKIGDRSRFQDGTHITGDCHIGDDCFFGVGVFTSNDRKVDLEDYHFPNPPQPCCFKDKVLVGSGANILAGVLVRSGATIGAGALVVKDVGENEVILGPVAKARKSDAELIYDNCTK
jgi:acetyltransferase-like isoleucine patch superfamily enzyme